jgi:hypothetical protein
MSIDINALWPYELRKGNSTSPENGACFMDAVSWFSRGELGDHPPCACPTLTAYIITGQDSMPHRTRQQLKRFIFRVIGSRDSKAESARRHYLIRAACCVFAPMALDAAGLSDYAQRLSALPDSVSFGSLAFILDEVCSRAYAISATAPDSKIGSYYSASRAANHALSAAGNWGHIYAAEHAALSACYAACVDLDRENEVWQAYMDVFDGALRLGNEGDFDLDIAPLRVKQFAEAVE